MSKTSNAGCVTCKARNKRCDLTRGPNGCRRCTRAGVICEGYLGTTSKVFRPRHTITSRPERTHPNEIEPSMDRLVPNRTLQPEENCAILSIVDPELDPNHADSSSDNSVPQWRHDLHSRVTVFQETHSTHLSRRVPVPPPSIAGTTPSIPQNSTPIILISTPVAKDQVDINAPRVCPVEPMTQGQASLLNSIFSLANSPPALPYAPHSSGSSMVRGLGTGKRQISGSRLNPDDDIEGDSSEIILVGLLDELALDREVDSNVLPFVAHSFTAWISRFLFEPTRVIPLSRDAIIRGHFGTKTLQRMILLADVVLALSKSTDYELGHFKELDNQLVTNVVETRTRSELTRETALEAMETCHEFISITIKVGSIASVLRIMELYAPLFRRACPEPGDKLVNLSEKLTSTGLIYLDLKFYASFDVLQSVITHRPMFFRYDISLLSPQDESLLNAENGPGLRWLIGVPDRLVFVLGKMNVLFEDHGNHLDLGMARELEKDIDACQPVASSDPLEEPSLVLGRLAVQESWRLAGYVYLYMGLCGADSSDARVIKVQKKFMRLLGGVKPRRNPDSFLLFPMLILGVATSSLSDQSILLARLWGVSECNKLGTMGNDVVRILNDIWASTVGRPAVWHDLRTACLRVIGI